MLPLSAPSPDRVRSWQERVKAAVTERLALKLAALSFALILWLVVSAEQPTEEWIDVRLALIADSSVTLRDSLPEVQALVVGRARDLLKLYSEPPVLRHAVGADTPDRAVIDLRPNDVDVPGNVDARVRDVRPRQLTLRVVVTEARRVPVRLAVDVVADSGQRLAGLPRVEPESVLVRGPRAVVRQLQAVSTVHDRLVIRDTTAQVVALDTARLGVRVTPPQVRVSATLVRAHSAATGAPGQAADSAARPPGPP